MTASRQPRLQVKREREVFERFLRWSSQSFERFEFPLEPEPDIMAWRGGQCFGIEITDFYREPEKERESIEDKLVESAQSYYMAQNLPDVHVTILWAHHFQITRENKARLAKKISELVRTHLPATSASVGLDWRSFDPELMSFVDRVWVDRPTDCKRSYWHAPRGRCVPVWDQKTLQAELDRKKDKPRNYCEDYAQTWLVLSSTIRDASSWVEMSAPANDAFYDSPFDRAFLVSSFPERVYELRLNGG